MITHSLKFPISFLQRTIAQADPTIHQAILNEK